MARNIEGPESNGPYEETPFELTFEAKAYLVRGDILDTSGLHHATATYSDIELANRLLAIGRQLSDEP